MTLRAAVFAALVLCTSAAAIAGQSIPADATYRIVHEDHGVIGVHKVTFSKDGEDLIVQVAGEAVVEVAFIPVYRFTTSRRETWRDGKLVAYLAETDDDDTDFRVSIERNGKDLHINTLEGHATAPGDLLLSHPWNLAITEQSRLIDTKTGALLNVAIAPTGEETLEIAGQLVKATRYVVTGDQPREIWYDQAGNWVKLRLMERGATVTMTREE